MASRSAAVLLLLVGLLGTAASVGGAPNPAGAQGPDDPRESEGRPLGGVQAVTHWYAYLPAVLLSGPVRPRTPALRVSGLEDGGNNYAVEWDASGRFTEYELQEARDREFTSALTVLKGLESSWVKLDARSGTYFYRLKAVDPLGLTYWSEPVIADVPSLYVGLAVRWDASGRVTSGGATAAFTMYQERMVTGNLDWRIAQVSNRATYVVNPFGVPIVEWFTTYDKARLTLVDISTPPSAAEKWAVPWVLPAVVAPRPGATVMVDGQPFDVLGRATYQGLPGRDVPAWRLANRDLIVSYSDGERAETLLPGTEQLWYAADASHLLLQYQEQRNEIRQGRPADSTRTVSGMLSWTNAYGPMPFTPR
jgi:YD repeat-containing protein